MSRQAPSPLYLEPGNPLPVRVRNRLRGLKLTEHETTRTTARRILKDSPTSPLSKMITAWFDFKRRTGKGSK